MTRRMTWWIGPLAGWLAATASGAEPAAAPTVPEPYEADYQAYDPDYGRWRGFVGWDFKEGAMAMKSSTETSFYTLTLLPESARAYALVEAAKAKEKAQRYQEAMEIYQKVIDEYPETMYRVSPHGVFVPIAHYCQLRLLGFPKDQLEFYRTKHDARAKELFEGARRRNSLEMLAQVRDNMLATSYGASALTTLGYAALDRGHFLEALEYFETVWAQFPDTRARDPELAVSVALCRKMLGLGERTGERYGLLGHWKLDETAGNTAHDSAGHGVNGTVSPAPCWTAGKVGGALRADMTNGVWVPESSHLDIGNADADFSVACWLWVDTVRTEWPPHGVFTKRSPDGKRMLRLWVTRQGYSSRNVLEYAIDTEHPEQEKGTVETEVARQRWTHVAFVKSGRELRLYLDGRLALCKALKGRALRIPGPINFGGIQGMLDDMRLYGRALSDREVAEFAGAAGAAALTAAPAAGEAPLTVEFAAATTPGDCSWEFGDGTTARGPKARHTYGLGGEYTAALTVTDPKGAIAVGRAKISAKDRPGDAEHRKRLAGVLDAARHDRQILAAQQASPGGVSAHDYLLLPPTADPLMLAKPVWSADLPGTRFDVHVYTDPVVTKHSVIFRHKNIVYCYSILSGELRWKNDLGGRVSSQDWFDTYQHPREDVLVHDGLVFTPIRRGGPTLAALDEVTGQLKWAYGPMAASSEEEARMRFETAPAAGPRAVYAGYVLDNIEGDTHVDTEYGVIAFESVSGRVVWRQEICRLRPGKFSAQFAAARRNLVRSFLSPPLYKEGTVYYCTNAGAIAALDALSGRIRWAIRYPYYLKPANVHDATVPFGEGPRYMVGVCDGYYLHIAPPFWFNQRPLLIEDALYVTPVDSPFLYRVDRRTGKIAWMRQKGLWEQHPDGYGGSAYFLGPMSDGNLVIAYTDDRYGYSGPVVALVEPLKGQTIWQSGANRQLEPEHLIEHQTHPVLKHQLGSYYSLYGLGHGSLAFQTAARPLLTSDDRVYVGASAYRGYPGVNGFMHNLGVLDLRARKVLDRRHYLDGSVLRWCEWAIKNVPAHIKGLEDKPNKDDKLKREIAQLKEVASDTVPVNPHGAFLPASRLTFERFGLPFELRMDARSAAMVYDRRAVAQAVRDRRDPEGLFARAELAVGAGRTEEASQLLQECLRVVPAEDLDFRAALNQQLYPVYKELARAGVRAGRPEAEMAACIGMNGTVNTLAEEMETLLALSEATERRGDGATAARLCRILANRFGQYEYAASSLWQGDREAVQETIGKTLGQLENLTRNNLYGKELAGAAVSARKGLGVYFGALCPIEKDLRVRAGEFAAARLIGLAQRFPVLKAAMEKEAQADLADKPPEEQVARLWEYPGTDAAQVLLDRLIEATETGLAREDAPLEETAALRKRAWALADAARIGGLSLPAGARARWLAPGAPPPPGAVSGAFENREGNLEDARSTAWLVLDRRAGPETDPDRLFLGGRVRKKLDNKFLLHGFDLKTGQVDWKATERRGDTWFDEIRLAGKGDEPGFTEAFVYRDAVVTHGRYDVLAFGRKDGRLIWRYEAPFAFEIRHAEPSGDLLALAGQSETIVLHLGTTDPRGEVVWQEKEEGDPYVRPFVVGDRLVSLRKMPFNLTVRYRSTGKLIGRLTLPDLLLNDENPLIENGARELPVTWKGSRMAVTDGAYYLMLDVEKMRVLWKRPIDANDPTRLPAMRLELDGDYLAVVKRDFDANAIYMVSSRTGEVLWQTDPKDPHSPQPVDSMLIRDGKLYGIKPHPGEAFYVAGMDCRTGKPLFAPNEQAGYVGKPDAQLMPGLYGDTLVARVRDQQDFELKVFSARDGTLLHTMQGKSAGDFGEHGRASAAVQNGRLALLAKDTLVTAGK